MSLYRVEYYTVFRSIAGTSKTYTGLNVIAVDAEVAIRRVRDHVVEGGPKPPEDPCEADLSLKDIVVRSVTLIDKIDIT